MPDNWLFGHGFQAGERLQLFKEEKDAIKTLSTWPDVP